MANIDLTRTAGAAMLLGTTEDTGSIVTTVKRGFFVACNFVGASRQFSRIGALMTYRNKAGNRTNKVGGVSSVVESMRRLSRGALSLINFGVMHHAI